MSSFNPVGNIDYLCRNKIFTGNVEKNMKLMRQ